MEFNFNINHLLGETITKLDCNFTPARRNAEGYDFGGLRSQLVTVIDKMGELSAQAQGLYTVITTGRKLQFSDHILYVMKDNAGNNGRGAAVGILKIGHKKLFVYSRHGNVHELEPLCVLDFYVHESRQRMGCGRKLFDYMLQDQGVKAHHLAIDKPSFKFSQFLKKHYNLYAELPQVNNFVVFEGFFSDRPDMAGKRSGGSRRPPVHPGKQRDMGKQGTRTSDLELRGVLVPCSPITDTIDSADQYGEEGVRRQNTYGGYGLPPLPPPPTQTLMGQGSRPPSGSSIRTRSSSVQSNHQKEMTQAPDFQRNGQLRPISATKDDPTEQRVVSAQAVKTQGQQMYNRHLSESPVGQLPGSRPSSNTQLPSNNLHSNVNQNAAYNDPPMLPRGGAPNSYLENFNLHREYQSRRGHLKVTSAMNPHIRNPFLSPEEDKKAQAAWQPQREATSWTVFNKPPGYLTIAQRNYTHTRLW